MFQLKELRRHFSSYIILVQNASLNKCFQNVKKYTERLILTAVKETKTQKTKYVNKYVATFVAPEEGLFCKPKYRAIFLFHTFFCFTYFVFCVFVSLTTVRISRSVYFFTSNVLLIQVYLRSGNSQRLVAVCFKMYPVSDLTTLITPSFADQNKHAFLPFILNVVSCTKVGSKRYLLIN